MLSIDLFRTWNGHIHISIIQKCRIFRNRVVNEEPTSRLSTVSNDTLGVSFGAGSLIVRFFIIPRNSFQPFCIDKRKSLSERRYLKVNFSVQELKLPTFGVGVVVSIAGISNHGWHFQNYPPGNRFPGGVQTAMGV